VCSLYMKEGIGQSEINKIMTETSPISF